ncbi:hypothetical protein [Devosia insulae]|uniref:hypothetical protein n=1 Tax=Devosia insulae TaxID=408174 RepID=UPI00114C9CC5|nr:hypothetical protein [Devosia insulae]
MSWRALACSSAAPLSIAQPEGVNADGRVQLVNGKIIIIRRGLAIGASDVYCFDSKTGAALAA